LTNVPGVTDETGFSTNISQLRYAASNVATSVTCGLYYKHITIVNDDSIMMLQVVASPMIVILMTLEVSFMLLVNIYNRGITHDDCHVTVIIYL
jgi:hypothetical protein